MTAVLELDRVVEQVGADGAGVRFHVFAGRTDARQEDVGLGEGQAMLFLTPDEIAAKELVSNAHMLFGPVGPYVIRDEMAKGFVVRV